MECDWLIVMFMALPVVNPSNVYKVQQFVFVQRAKEKKERW